MKILEQLIVRVPFFSINGTQSVEAFEEALYLASPDLYYEYKRMLNNEVVNTKEIQKIEDAVYKYKKRASIRCTPFGLFASVSVAQFGEKSSLHAFSSNLKEDVRRKTRLDMQVLCLLIDVLDKSPLINRSLTYFTNRSVYKIGNQYRYIDWTQLDKQRFYKIAKVDVSEAISTVLAFCKHGCKREDLERRIAQLFDVSGEDAFSFVTDLIDAQLLLSELEPAVTGDELLEIILHRLSQVQKDSPSDFTENFINILNQVKEYLREMDQQVLNSKESYAKVHLLLRQIIPDLAETNLFQTDSYRRLNNDFRIDASIKEKLLGVVTFLDKITPPKSDTRLDTFKQDFFEKYGDREIPLLLALDSESGVGYQSKDTTGINALLDGLRFNNKDVSPVKSIQWDRLQSCLLQLVAKSIKSGATSITISESDFPDIDFSGKEVSGTMAVMFSILGGDNKILFKNAGGSSAINILGRFAGGDPKVNSLAKEIATLEQDQYPDYIVAEIAHLPESRTGNILSRPVFRTFEIPYLAQSAVDIAYQILPEDLYVSIRNGQIVLRSKSLNKQVIPRLSNAHNYAMNSLPVYYFLCDMQFNFIEKSNFAFSWGVLENQFPFLPRVEYKGVVLSPARWRLTKNMIKRLNDKSYNQQQRESVFYSLKKEILLTDKFLVVDGDNELLIDLSERGMVSFFLNFAKNREELILEEFLFEHKEAAIQDSDFQPYTNECVAILVQDKRDVTYDFLKVNEKEYNNHHLSIGSEWLYYKIYCGLKTADDVLVNVIKPLVDELVSSRKIEKWFFIRYADPEFHLRVRFKLIDKAFIGEIIQQMHDGFNDLLKNNVVQRLQIDTYVRELERYGSSTIELAEDLFFLDSEFVLYLLDSLDLEGGHAIRWKMALRSVDSFLSGFNFTVREKFEFTYNIAKYFFQEHGGDKEMKLQLDKKFRDLRKEVEFVLDESKDNEKEYLSILNFLKLQTKKIKTIAVSLKAIEEQKGLEVSIESLLGSYIHMNLDRLFMGQNRTNEFLVFVFLSKYYKTELAKNENWHNKIGQVYKEVVKINV